jgi:hypothetical protein
MNIKIYSNLNQQLKLSKIINNQNNREIDTYRVIIMIRLRNMFISMRLYYFIL